MQQKKVLFIRLYHYSFKLHCKLKGFVFNFNCLIYVNILQNKYFNCPNGILFFFHKPEFCDPRVFQLMRKKNFIAYGLKQFRESGLFSINEVWYLCIPVAGFAWHLQTRLCWHLAYSEKINIFKQNSISKRNKCDTKMNCRTSPHVRLIRWCGSITVQAGMDTMELSLHGLALF